jgi:cytochrome oxidase Cu insertion factor (SCO1/SenC/PrrC family)
MDFETALYNELNPISGIGKVFPLKVIDGIKPPFTVYESSDGTQEKTLSGFVNSTEIDGTIWVVTTSYSSMKSVSRAVISKLQSFQGRIIGGSGGVMVYEITYDKVRETYDDNVQFYQAMIDFTVRI